MEKQKVRMVSSERRPSVDVAKRIASVLGFDWKEFYEEEKRGRSGADEK